MGHSIGFTRFCNGEPTPFDLELLRDILIRHGCSVSARNDGNFTILFPTNGDSATIGNEDGLIAVVPDGAIEFGIERPVYDDALRALSFDLLDKLKLCAFPSFGQEIVSAHDCEEHIPKDLLDTSGNGLQIVTSPDQLW